MEKINFEAILGPMGARLHRDRADKWWELDCGRFHLAIDPGWRRRHPGYRLSIDYGISHKELSAVASRILGDPPDTPQTFKSEQGRAEVGSLASAGEMYRKMIKEQIESVQKTDMDKVIKDFAANCPDRPSMRQIMHLAALARLADFNTLTDYQKIFARGHRMNFVPMISQAMIERALDIAMERV